MRVAPALRHISAHLGAGRLRAPIFNMLLGVAPTAIVACVGRKVVCAVAGDSSSCTVVDVPERVRHMLVSASDSGAGRIALLTEDKKLTTFAMTAEGCSQVSTRTLEKRGTAITSMTLRQPARPAAMAGSGGAGAAAAAAAAPPAAEAVLIASDKFGDAFAFPDPDVGSKKRWLLGHTGSIVTALAGSLDSRFLLSADREERIRVSHFPAAYNVESFCLGHTRFVTALHVLRQGVPLPGWGAASPAAAAQAPSPVAGAASSSSSSSAASSSAADASAPFPSAAAAVAGADAVAAAQLAAAYAPGELLVSAGAEGALRLWHWRSGTLLHTVYLQPGEDIVYLKGVTLRRHTLPPLNGAVSGGAAAGSSASGAPIPGSSSVSGPLSLDDDGQYGCLSAVGSHADSDMNRMENSDEAEIVASSSSAAASSSSSSAAAASADAPAAAAASVAVEAEAASDSAAADAAVDATDAGSSAGAGALEGVEAVPGGAAAVTGKVIPKAWEGSERPQSSARHATPPVLPGQVEECGATGLLATVVDGEHAVRLLGVGAGELGDAIPAPRSNAPASLTSQCSPGLAATVIGGRLPQARLSQVAVLRTPFRPLALRFLGSGHASSTAPDAAAGAVTHLLLGYAERQGEAAAEASFRLAVVRVRQAGGAVSAVRLSDGEVEAHFPLVAAANARLADIPLSAGVATVTRGSWVGSSKAPGAAAAAAPPAEAPEVLVRSNPFAASLEEFDKHWNVYKPRTARADAGAGAGDAAADAGDD